MRQLWDDLSVAEFMGQLDTGYQQQLCQQLVVN